MRRYRDAALRGCGPRGMAKAAGPPRETGNTRSGHRPERGLAGAAEATSVSLPSQMPAGLGLKQCHQITHLYVETNLKRASSDIRDAVGDRDLVQKDA